MLCQQNMALPFLGTMVSRGRAGAVTNPGKETVGRLSPTEEEEEEQKMHPALQELLAFCEQSHAERL